MLIEVPQNHTTNLSIMFASLGYYMIREDKSGNVPTELHQLANVFNQLMEDEDGLKGDFFETIAQQFPDVTDIIRSDPMVRTTTSYKEWS